MVDAILGCCRGDDFKPKVSLQIGKVIGSTRETKNGTEYVSFVGIPYAEPPIGHLRFRRPVPVQPWVEEEKALDASKRTLPKPTQITNSPWKRVIGNEDCLRLSVYTPDLPVTQNQGKLPVVAWFMGWDFNTGDVNENKYGPDHFMDFGGTVVVMVSYRVGPFGFLCLGDEYVPGNQGLWDQQMALRWIQQHISHFGGDKNMVTLAGHGAGSVCVSYHLVSPQSAGLFSHAICMSGTFISPSYTFDKDPELVGREFVGKLGCPDKEESVDQILIKLQNLKASEIAKATDFLKDWDAYTPTPWLPIIDAKHVKKDPFIPENPIELIKKGNFNKMPTLIGHTKNEGIWFTAKTLANGPAALNSIDNEWDKLGCMILCNKSADEIEEDDIKIIKGIKDFYYGQDASLTKRELSTVIEMFGDCAVLGANEYLSSLIIGQSAQPVYVYSFDYHGNWRFGDFVLPAKKLWIAKFLSFFGIKPNDANSHGVSHGDDIFYLFSSKQSHLKRIGKSTPQDEMVQKKMIQLWMNFIQNSNPTPNPESDPLLKNFTWKPLAAGKQHYAVIASAVELREYDEDLMLRSNFWKRLLEEEIRYPTTFSDKPPVMNEKIYSER